MHYIINYMLTILDKLIYIFSPSPIHFEVKDEALMLKKVNPDLAAIHFAIIVLPVPGGPKRSNPCGGARNPWKISGLINGSTTISLIDFFTKSSPAMSFQSTGLLLGCERIL